MLPVSITQQQQQAELGSPSVENVAKAKCDLLRVNRNSPQASSKVRIVDKEELLSTEKVDMSVCDKVEQVKKPQPAMKHVDINLYRENLQQAVKRDECMTYVEWGSGGSTFIAPEYSSRVLSIENHPEWCNIMLANPFIQCKIAQGHLIYICVDGGPVQRWGTPANSTEYLSHLYLDALSNFDDITPDMVLVDGRYRVACAMNSVNWSKPDSVLMIHDYHNRHQYHVVEKFFDPVQVRPEQGSRHVFGIFTRKSQVDSEAYQKQLEQYRKIHQ